MYRRRPCTAVSHSADDLRAYGTWRWGGLGARTLPSPGAGRPGRGGGGSQAAPPLPTPARALLAVVAKADDVRVGAVAAGDGLVLKDACNTGEAAAGSPASASRAATTAGPHGLHGGSLTTVTLTVNAACWGTRGPTCLSPAPAHSSCPAPGSPRVALSQGWSTLRLEGSGSTHLGLQGPARVGGREGWGSSVMPCCCPRDGRGPASGSCPSSRLRSEPDTPCPTTPRRGPQPPRDF